MASRQRGKKTREREGNERGAHSELASEQSGLGGGLTVPESTAKLVGAEEEDDGVGDVVVAPGLVQWHWKE
jgi:hypothetical protein